MLEKSPDFPGSFVICGEGGVSVPKIIKHFSSRTVVPIDIWDDVKPAFEKLGVKDEIYFFPDGQLDARIVRGKIVYWDYPSSEQGPRVRVAEITYSANQEHEWQRLVCCKEMLHIFDSVETRVSKPEEIERLIEKIRLPADLQDPFTDGVHALTDRVAVLYAAAVLFPIASRDVLMKPYSDGKITLQEIADKLEVPIRYAALVMSAEWPDIHQMLILEPTPFRVVRHKNKPDGTLAERAVLNGQLESRGAAVAFIEAEAEKNLPSGFDEEKGQWWITNKQGERCILLIER